MKVANGDSKLCEGRSDQVAFKVQEHNFTTNFYALILGDCNVILGVYWLKTLGPILWDFMHLTMTFELEGRKVELCGLHPRFPRNGQWRKRRSLTSLLNLKKGG